MLFRGKLIWSAVKIHLNYHSINHLLQKSEAFQSVHHVVFIVICRNIPTLNTLQNISEVISITGIGFIRLFLNGALWSLCGSLTAVLTKNKYLSCAVPFILYYVLTVFQERYYRNYFFLSPKQWASPAYYGNGFCLLALLLISSLLALALRKCVVRRVVKP